MIDMDKVQLYHVIFDTIKNNPGITLNQLVWLVGSSLNLPEEQIKQATETLMYQTEELPRCINYHTIPKERTKKGIEVVHLRCSEKFASQAEELLFKHQETHGYVVPELTFNRVTKNASLLKKA